MYALPDDIHPEGFGCLRIYYPLNAGYRRAVLGAVSYLGNWYAWQHDDQKRGKDAAAQFRLAYALTVDDILAGKTCDCDEQPPTPPITPEEATAIMAGITIEGDEDMGQVVTDVQLVDGKLRVFFGHCCYVDLDLNGVVSGSTPPVDTEDIPDAQPEADASCRVANAIVEAVRALIEECWEHRDVLIIPLAIARTKRALPDLTLNETTVGAIISALALLDNFGVIDEAFPDSEWQTWKCALAKDLADEYKFDSSDFVIAARTGAGAFVELIDIVEGFGKAALIAAALRAIGQGTLDDIAHAAIAGPGEPDCRCPNEIEDWDSYEWSQVFDLTVENPFTTITTGTWAEGVGLQSQRVGTSQQAIVKIDPNHTGGGDTIFQFARAYVAGIWTDPDVSDASLLQFAAGDEDRLDVANVVGGRCEWLGEVTIAADNVTLTTSVSFDPGGSTAWFYIKKFVVAGYGVNPFA